MGKFVNGGGARNSVTLWKLCVNRASRSTTSRFTGFELVDVVLMFMMELVTDELLLLRIEECRCGGTGAGAVAVVTKVFENKIV